MKLRKNWIAAAVFAAAIALAGCGGQTSSGTASGSEESSGSPAVETTTASAAETTEASAAKTTKESAAETTEVSAAQETESIQEENPWKETADLDEAVKGSGVDFVPPEPDIISAYEGLEGGDTPYAYMDGTIEVNYTNGTDTLVIRKSYESSGDELSGDYTEYSKEWDIISMGVSVHCKGDGESINNATMSINDGSSYSILANPGEEGKGISEEDINAIMQNMQ